MLIEGINSDNYDAELKVFDMSWFIRKYDPVTEDRTFVRRYNKVWRVSSGPQMTIPQDLHYHEDRVSNGAPIYKDGGYNGEGVKHFSRIHGGYELCSGWGTAD